MPKETKSLSSAILKVADATKPGTTPLEVLSLISNEIVPWLPGPQAKLVGKIVGFIFQTLAEKEKEKDDLKEIRNSLATIEGKVDKLSNEAVHNFNIAQLNKDLTSATSDLKEAIYTWQHELADTSNTASMYEDILQRIGQHDEKSVQGLLNKMHLELTEAKSTSLKLSDGTDQSVAALKRFRDVLQASATRTEPPYTYDVVDLHDIFNQFHKSITGLLENGYGLLMLWRTYAFLRKPTEDAEGKLWMTAMNNYSQEQTARAKQYTKVLLEDSILPSPSAKFLVQEAQWNAHSPFGNSLYMLQLRSNGNYLQIDEFWDKPGGYYFPHKDGQLIWTSSQLPRNGPHAYNYLWSLRHTDDEWRLDSSRFMWHGVESHWATLMKDGEEFGLWGDGEGKDGVKVRLIPDEGSENGVFHFTILLLKKDGLGVDSATFNGETYRMSFPVKVDTSRDYLREMAFGTTLAPSQTAKEALIARLFSPGQKRAMLTVKLESNHNFVMQLVNARGNQQDNILFHNTLWLAGGEAPIVTCDRMDANDIEVVLQFRLHWLAGNVNAGLRSDVEAVLQRDQQTGRLAFSPPSSSDKKHVLWRDVFIKIGNPTGWSKNWMSVVVARTGYYDIPSVWSQKGDQLHNESLKSALHSSDNYRYQNTPAQRDVWPGVQVGFEIKGSESPDAYLLIKTTDSWSQNL